MRFRRPARGLCGPRDSRLSDCMPEGQRQSRPWARAGARLGTRAAAAPTEPPPFARHPRKPRRCHLRPAPRRPSAPAGRVSALAGQNRLGRRLLSRVRALSPRSAAAAPRLRVSRSGRAGSRSCRLTAFGPGGRHPARIWLPSPG